MKQTKICLICKKPFTNRKKWKQRNQFEQVKYCSQRCRNKPKNEKRKNP